MGERGERAESLAAYKIILKVNPACLSSHYVVTCNILPLASFHIVFRLFIARDVGTLFSITARPVAVEQKFSFSFFICCCSPANAAEWLRSSRQKIGL